MGLNSPDRVIDSREAVRRGLILPIDYTPLMKPDPSDTPRHCIECRNQVVTPGNPCPCCGWHG